MATELDEILGRQDTPPLLGRFYFVRDASSYEPDAGVPRHIACGLFVLDRIAWERFEVVEFRRDWGALLCSHRQARLEGPFSVRTASVADHFTPSLRTLLGGDVDDTVHGAGGPGWVHGKIRAWGSGWLPWSALAGPLSVSYEESGVLNLDAPYRDASLLYGDDYDF